MNAGAPLVRAAKDADGFGIAALIGAVFSEYRGCVFVLSEMPEIAAIAKTFRQAGGAFWVAEKALYRQEVIVGCVGYVPIESGIELRKLYVAKAERTAGLGGKLLAQVESAAKERGARSIELWSDTRFATAHAFYEKRGYVRGATRELHDASESVEYSFNKTLI